MSYAGSFQMWLGVAILIGLLFILVVSLKNSAAKVVAGRTDLERWHGSVTGWFLALVALIVFMAFQNLVLLVVLISSLGRRLSMDSTSGMLAVRYILPAFLSFLLFSTRFRSTLLSGCGRPGFRKWLPRCCGSRAR